MASGVRWVRTGVYVAVRVHRVCAGVHVRLVTGEAAVGAVTRVLTRPDVASGMCWAVRAGRQVSSGVRGVITRLCDDAVLRLIPGLSRSSLAVRVVVAPHTIRRELERETPDAHLPARDQRVIRYPMNAVHGV